MGHEVILFGCIVGVDPEHLHTRNSAVIVDLPVDDEWPFLGRGMFALPERWPRGTYRSHVIHFGASLKDEPSDPSVWEGWLAKFEALLRQLFWWSAELQLRAEGRQAQMYEWLATSAAVDRMFGDSPQPVHEWERSMIFLPTASAGSDHRACRD